MIQFFATFVISYIGDNTGTGFLCIVVFIFEFDSIVVVAAADLFCSKF
jgi:hypothetical protein